MPPDGLRLRAGPSTDERVVDLIPGGTRIALTGQATADGWYPAVYKAQRGWVLGSHLAFDDLTAAAARRAVVAAADGLNLRAAPLPTADILTVLPGGTALTVTGRATGDGWALVLAGDLTGWVTASYLAIEGQPAAPAPAPAGGLAASPALEPAAPPAPAAGATRVTVSYYNPSYEGSPLACGGVYHADDLTVAATNSWPCGTALRVCRGAACVAVTVRDKGAMGPNFIDVSAAAFQRLGASLNDGVITATAEVVTR